MPPSSAAPRVVLPVSLQIPTLKINSVLQPVYTAPDGSLSVPVDVHTTGWWAQGVQPGDPGAAVIVGHVDSHNGPGVFIALRTMHPGQSIRISRVDGSVAVFMLDGLREFRKTQFPTDLVYGATPNAELRLVTCGGEFNRASGHYLDNVVAFAHLTNIEPPSGQALSGFAGGT
jgi:hypothetical protein